MLDSLRMAVGTLTAVPVPAPRVIDRRVAGGAMLLAPVAAIPLAALAGLVMWGGSSAGLPGLVSAGIAVGAVALGSRGLHLDGLADTADGLGASYDRERALEIMRRGNSGPTGVATLVLVLIVQCGALAAAGGAVVAGGAWAGGGGSAGGGAWSGGAVLAGSGSSVAAAAGGAVVAASGGTVVAAAGSGVVAGGAWAAVVAVLAGRCVLSLCCTRGVPSARPEGLGATVAGSVPIPAAAAVFVVVAGLSALAPGYEWWRGPVAVALAYVVAGLLLWRCTRRLGGITGDVLGACVEAATTAALVALAV